VKPSHSVLVVGAHESLLKDPSAAFAAERVSSKGKITFLDCQSRTALNLLSKIGKKPELLSFLKKHVLSDYDGHGVTGDPVIYRKFLREFYSKRGLTPPKIGVWFANVLDTKLEDSSVDSIIDHGTASFAVDLQIPENLPRRIPKLKKGEMIFLSHNPAFDLLPENVFLQTQKRLARKLIREYLRVLTPGGKVIFFHTPREEEEKHAFGKMLEKLAEKTGLKIERHAVDSSDYEIAGTRISPSKTFLKALVVTKLKK
jgi:hypothetical protein